MLRRGLDLKLLALGAAIFLWFYVFFTQTNPVIERTLYVPLHLRELPSDVVVASAPEQVRVRLRGTRDRVSAVSEPQVRALVRVGSAKPGRHVRAVRVETPQGVEAVQVSPESARVVLERIVSRWFSVEPVLTGEPPAGYQVRGSTVSPRQTRVRGPESVVARVAQVVVSVDRSAVVLEMPQSGLLKAVDAQGKEVKELELSPNVATAKLEAQRTIASRTVPVLVQTTGTPAAGYQVVRATVEPAMVTVAGEAQQLRAIQGVFTGVVRLDGARRTYTQSAPLILPQGAQYVSARAVRVRVVIGPQPPTAPQAPR